MSSLDIYAGFAAVRILVILVRESQEVPLAPGGHNGAVIARHQLWVLVVGVVAHAPCRVQVLVHKVKPCAIAQLNLFITVLY